MGVLYKGQRMGIRSILAAFTIVARLVAEFGPRIRAAFPEADGLLAFLSALETAAALLIAAQSDVETLNAPGESDETPISWDALPGNLNT